MPSEEGEIFEGHLSYAGQGLSSWDPSFHVEQRPHNISGTMYSTEIEWPGDSDQSSDALRRPDTFDGKNDNDLSYVHSTHSPIPASQSRANAPASLRFVVQQSSILPKTRTLAIIDGYTEVQIGRDVAPPGSDIPRIRLKEMEVSKLHAAVYWDQGRHEWAIVDMGSKHGTFLKYSYGSSAGPLPVVHPSPQQSGSGSEEVMGSRLSSPRAASMPCHLVHLACLTIGGTTFVVHIHEDHLACADCSPKGDDEIPLFGLHRAERNLAEKRRRQVVDDALDGPTAVLHRPRQDPRKTLTMLKHSLLSRHDIRVEQAVSAQYVDRSARRRAFFPHTPAGNVPEHAKMSTPLISKAERTITIPHTHVSLPSTPLPDTNIGHCLLLRQGWQPGTSLGQVTSRNDALVEPLEARGNAGRAGLGMSSLTNAAATASTSGDNDWREEAKLRRWSSIQMADVAR